VSEVVARVDHEVGLHAIGEVGDPALLAVLPRRHVRVGEVEDGERGRARRQERQLVPPHREQEPLDARAPDGGGETHRPRRRDGGEGGATGGAH
jgi:hypothetical protein